MSSPQIMNQREMCRFWGVTKPYIDSKVKAVLDIIPGIDQEDILHKLNEYGMNIEKVVLHLLDHNASNHNNLNPTNTNHNPISDEELDRESILTNLHPHAMIGPIINTQGFNWCCDNPKCTKTRPRKYRMAYFKSKELDDAFTLCDKCVRSHSAKSNTNSLSENPNISNIPNSDESNTRKRKRKGNNVNDEIIEPKNKRRKLIRFKDKDGDKENENENAEMANDESEDISKQAILHDMKETEDDEACNDDDDSNVDTKSLSSISSVGDDSADLDYSLSLSASNSPSNNVFALYRYKNAISRSRSKQNSNSNSKQERDSDEDEPVSGPTTNNSNNSNKEDPDDDEHKVEVERPKKQIMKKKCAKRKKLWKQKLFNPFKIKYSVTPKVYDETKHRLWQKTAVEFNLTVDDIKPLDDISSLYRLRSDNSCTNYICEYDKSYMCDDKSVVQSLYNDALRELFRKPRKPKKKKNEQDRRDYTIQAHIKKSKDITKKSEKELRRYSAEIEISLNRFHKTGHCFVVDIPGTIALTARSQELTNDIIESMHIRDMFTGNGHQNTCISLLDFACRYNDKPWIPLEFTKQCKICDTLPMRNAKMIPCGHTFCNRCVFAHFISDADEECPVCDRQYNSSEVTQFVDFSLLYDEDEDEDDDDDEAVEECEDKELMALQQEKYGLTVIAFPYQIQSIEWMLERETDKDGLYKYLFRKGQFKNGETFYYSAVLQRLVLVDELPVLHGGFLCEEMGLGKTVECLAVIHCNRRNDEYSTWKRNVVAMKETALRRKRVEVKQRENVNENDNENDNMFSALFMRPKKKKKIYKYVQEMKEYTYYKGKGTLIIGPVSLIGQWEHEVDTRSNGKLLYKRYYGQRSRNIKHYFDYDIIFTTYGVLAKEDGHDRRNHVLHRIEWHRIILDESHYIKNGAARTSIHINQLKGNSKWLLSGTPFEKPIDLVNQLKFIGINQEYINAMGLKEHHSYSKSLLKVVKHMMMRHKKGQKFNNKQILQMPDKEEDVIYVEFDAQQKEYYDKLYAIAKEAFDSYAATGNIGRGFIPILSSLHPARMACSGYIASMNAIEEQLSAAQESTHKIRAMVQRHKNKSSAELYQLARVEAYNADGQCVICLEAPPDEPLQTPCRHIFCGECIRDQLETNGNCPICRKVTNVNQLRLPLSAHKDNDNTNSNNVNNEEEIKSDDTVKLNENETIKFDAKLKVLVSELNKLKRDRPDDKSLIFTSFSKSLEWICSELENNNIKYSTLTGSMTMNKRAQNLKRFSTDPDVKVFVLTVRTGAVGLTLTSANHVFMMEPTFNPALHRQAINRVYRLGQEKTVHIHTLIMKDSIEQRIWNVNKDKQKGDIDNKKNKKMYGNIKDDKAGALQNTEIEKLFASGSLQNGGNEEESDITY